MSSLNDLFADDAAGVLLNADEFAQTLTVVDAAGVSRSLTAVVDRQPTRIELRGGHRLRIETADVSAAATSSGLSGVTDGWGADIDADPAKPLYDFIDTLEADHGLITARFERTTILDTGLPQPADI